MAAATAPASRVRTYEQFLREYDGTFAEWEAGVIIPMSPVTFSHQDISTFLLSLLRFSLADSGRGQALSAPFQMRLRNIDRGREPDVMVVLAENAGRITNTYLDGPADLVIEIVSPGSVIRDRETKYAEYEAEGVREYWILDPATMQADFFVREADVRFARRLPDARGVYASVVIEGFWIDVAWLWRRPLPTLRQVLGEWERNAQ